jgi:cob(I)alamin adenosyltransferase
MIHVYTGQGKGKTTAAFGLAMRHAAYPNNKVLIVQFMKKHEYGEVGSARKLGIVVQQFGLGEYYRADMSAKKKNAHRQAALEGLEYAKRSAHDYSLVILDEINIALHYGLLKLDEVLPLLDSKNEVVFTGRNAPQKLVELADYVSSVDEVKHPFQRGIDAREGVEL